MRNVLFGSMQIFVLFMLARAAFDSFKIAAISSVLLLLDPLHIIISRSSLEDPPAVLFLLSGFYLRSWQ